MTVQCYAMNKSDLFSPLGITKETQTFLFPEFPFEFSCHSDMPICASVHFQPAD